MSVLRTLAVVAVLAAAVFTAPSAGAVTTIQTLSFSVSPAKSGSVKKPRGASLNVIGTTRNSDGTQAPTMTTLDLYFPKQFRFRTRDFPTCPQKVMDRQGPQFCPRGSRVGDGAASVLAGPLREELRVTAFNGPQQQLLLFLTGDKPISVSQALAGKLSPSSGKFGYHLLFKVPNNFQQPAPGLMASVTRLQVHVSASIRKHGRKLNYIETTGCPKGGLWPFLGKFTTQAAQVLTVPATQRCKK